MDRRYKGKDIAKFFLRIEDVHECFSKAEHSIKVLRDTSDIASTEIKPDKMVNKRRADALSTGQSVLNTANETIKSLKGEVDKERREEEAYWQ